MLRTRTMVWGLAVASLLLMTAAFGAGSARAANCAEGTTVSSEAFVTLTPEERASCGFGQHPSAARIKQAEIEEQSAQSNPAVAQKLADSQRLADTERQKSRAGAPAPLFPAGTMMVPWIQQSTYYYCGPASTLMALRYMAADAGLSANDAVAQDELWPQVGGVPANGSDSIAIASVLNGRQSRNFYLGGYYNMSGCDIDCFKVRWQYDFDHSSPGIPNIDTNELTSYALRFYEHYVTQRGYDWGPDTVSYNDPNSLEHGGIWDDSRGDMWRAITQRNSGLQSFVW